MTGAEAMRRISARMLPVGSLKTSPQPLTFVERGVYVGGGLSIAIMFSLWRYGIEGEVAVWASASPFIAFGAWLFWRSIRPPRGRHHPPR